MNIPLFCWFSFSSLLPNLQYCLGPLRRWEPLPLHPPARVGEKGECFHLIKNRISWISIFFLGRKKLLPLASGRSENPVWQSLSWP